MKDVMEMTIEECVTECQSIEPKSMEGASRFIERTGWDWQRSETKFIGKENGCKTWKIVERGISPTLDLWRLAVLVWRAKSKA